MKGKIIDTAYLLLVWRAKHIFDEEGIDGPGHAIPEFKTARLLSLFLCGDLSEVQQFSSMIRRVVAGDGLDVVATKELLQKYFDHYDDWAPEIDRIVRLVAVMFSPMVAPAPYVENNVFPLSEMEEYSSRFADILSAKSIYSTLHEKNQVPLDVSFSKHIARVAPYLSFRQVQYCLQARSTRDWQPEDLRRLRYVVTIRNRFKNLQKIMEDCRFYLRVFSFRFLLERQLKQVNGVVQVHYLL